MPVRKKCPDRSNRDGIAEAPETAMSSGSGIMSGFMGPVRRQETASPALCRIPRMCTMQNL